MVENSQRENLRREQEAREDACRREQEAREETKRREQAFEQREKEIRRQNEQREYDFHHQVQIETENWFLHEQLAAAEKEKEKELFALCEKQKQEQLVSEKLLELEKQQAEKLVSEKFLELEQQKLELERQKTAFVAEQQAPGDSRVSEIGSSIGSRDQSEEVSDKIIVQGKIISDADKQLEMQQVSANKLFLQNKIISQQEVGSLQSENKINSEINSELLLDALMSDSVDVHPFTAGTLHALTADDVHDVVHSLTAADVVVCSHSIYTSPQLTDSLGAQHACLPVCTSATTATTTQPGQSPLLMINDTQPLLPLHLYSQHTPALIAACQPASVQQPTTTVHQSVTGVHPAAVPVCQQFAATVYTQPACTQPSVTQSVCTQPPTPQLLCTQPSTTWSVYTQPTPHSH